MGAIVCEAKAFVARFSDSFGFGDRPPTNLYDLPSEALYAEAGDVAPTSDQSGSHSVSFTVSGAVCLKPLIVVRVQPRYSFADMAMGIGRLQVRTAYHSGRVHKRVLLYWRTISSASTVYALWPSLRIKTPGRCRACCDANVLSIVENASGQAGAGEEWHRFDDITRLVSTIFNAPIALVSLVEQERQWFKSVVGLQASPLSHSHYSTEDLMSHTTVQKISCPNLFQSRIDECSAVVCGGGGP